MDGEGVTSARRGRQIWKSPTREADLDVSSKEGGHERQRQGALDGEVGTSRFGGRRQTKTRRPIWGEWRCWTVEVDRSWEWD